MMPQTQPGHDIAEHSARTGKKPIRSRSIRSKFAASLALAAMVLAPASPAWAQDGQTKDAPAADDDACFVITGPVRFGYQRRLRILAKNNQVESLLAKGYEQISCRGYEQTVSEVSDKICSFENKAPAEIQAAFQEAYGISATEVCEITGNKKLKTKRQDSFEDWLEKNTH